MKRKSCKGQYEGVSSSPQACSSQGSVSTQEDRVANDPVEAEPVSRRKLRKYTKLNPTKPVRESERIKKIACTIKQEINPHKVERKTIWTKEYKTSLLKGLETHGPNNVNAIIRDFLPDVSPNELKFQIRLWQELAQSELQKKFLIDKTKANSSLMKNVANLNDWIDHFQGLASTASTNPIALSQVFLLISEYGKFPPPEECENIDFRAMYRYLHCMLNGEPYFGMNPTTARVLNDSISMMMHMIREYDEEVNLQAHLFTHNPPVKTRWRNYGRQPCRVERRNTPSNAEAIINLPHLNPLRIPPHIFKKPQPEEVCELILDDDNSEN